MKRDYCAGLVRSQMAERSIVLCAMGSTGAAWRAQKAPHLTYFVSDPMGMALPMSLGVALAQPDRPVVLLDGDGDFSTGVSALFAIADSAPPNLKIAVFNNAKYESGGGQPLPGAGRMSISVLAEVPVSHGAKTSARKPTRPRPWRDGSNSLRPHCWYSRSMSKRRPIPLQVLGQRRRTSLLHAAIASSTMIDRQEG